MFVLFFVLELKTLGVKFVLQRLHVMKPDFCPNEFMFLLQRN